MVPFNVLFHNLELSSVFFLSIEAMGAAVGKGEAWEPV